MLMKKVLVAAAVSAAIAACSNTKVVETPEPAPMPVASAPVAEAPIASAPVVAEAPTSSGSHNSVYFAFDKYDVREGYSGIVKSNADYLAANSNAKVQVQGNTDDIGSVEYNLALGQRRADAVKKALIAGGAAARHIEATSNGKLKPKYPNDNDAGRAQNRRSDIEYKSGQPGGYSQDSNGLPMVDGSFYSGTVVEGVLEGDYQPGAAPRRHHKSSAKAEVSSNEQMVENK